MNQIVMNMGKGGTQTTSYGVECRVLTASPAQIDQLFETVLTLANHADDLGLEATAQQLEATLDTLL